MIFARLLPPCPHGPCTTCWAAVRVVRLMLMPVAVALRRQCCASLATPQPLPTRRQNASAILRPALSGFFDNTWNAFRDGMGKYEDMRCEYLADARLSSGWQPEQMRCLPELAKQLLQRKDLDLVVGMAVVAVKALLAVNDGRTPILAWA